MKKIILLILMTWSISAISQEKLDIAGKVKISTMDVSDSDSIVVWNSDGTLGIGQSSALNKIILNAFANKNETFTSDSTGTVLDKDGNIYNTVKIGSQWWMAENLRTTRYSNGDSITYEEDNTAWAGLTTGGYCFYDTSGSEYLTYSQDTFGALYNWYAVDDSRGLCPSGWHVPSDDLPSDSEWQTLVNYLSPNAGTKMKTTSGWFFDGNGDNTSGFSGPPGGNRHGPFADLGNYGNWWSSTVRSSGVGGYREMGSDDDVVSSNYLNSVGVSVRCLRD